MTLFEEKYREIVESTQSGFFLENQSRICAAKFTKVELVCGFCRPLLKFRNKEYPFLGLVLCPRSSLPRREVMH